MIEGHVERRTPVSGTQHTLRRGDHRAVVAGVGASLRSYTVAGCDLVVPYGIDELRPAYRGVTLAPWPNRVVDGRYRFAGREHRLALTEPERGHALHGLVAWREWDLVDSGAEHVVLATVVEPQTGYPWRILVETAYRLDGDGLVQQVTATDLSDTAAPWGTGPHPYLRAGDGRVDDWTLELGADQVLAVTADRLVPTGLEPVTSDPARFDFRRPRPIGDAEIDHAFTGLHRGADGVARVRVRDAHGAGVEMSWDAACPWVQIHTADRPDGPADPGHRVGLAVEPMTCPPDAFNSGTDLIVLEPGASSTASWTISPLLADDAPGRPL